MAIKRPDKNTCMLKHFVKRFRQRFNIQLSKDDYNSIISSIRKNKPNVEFLYKQTCTKSIYKITYHGIEFGVVYNRERMHIHTCFPLEWADNSIIRKEDLDDIYN